MNPAHMQWLADGSAEKHEINTKSLKYSVIGENDFISFFHSFNYITLHYILCICHLIIHYFFI